MPTIRHARRRRCLTVAARRFGALLALAAAMQLAVFATSSSAQNAEIARRRAHERTQFTDAQIVKGFFRIALGAEFHLAGRVDRIRKYDRPVRVYVDSRATPDRRAQVTEVVADIGAKVRHLDIGMTDDPKAAQVVVTLVRDRDLESTIRALYGRGRARRIQKSLDPQCLSGFRKDARFRILHSDVILVVDAGEFIFYDCAYEELLQALGPINDDSSVPWTMFNDDVQMGFFDVYDQYLLNILYDPRIKPGMNAHQVRALMPTVLKSARAWVAKVNGLK
jgi:Protein of unknown function (DUF2927)